MFKTNNGFVFNNLRDALYMVIRDSLTKPKNSLSRAVSVYAEDERVVFHAPYWIGVSSKWEGVDRFINETLASQKRIAPEKHRIHRIKILKTN